MQYFQHRKYWMPRVAKANTRAWLGALSGQQRNFVVTVFIPSQTRDGAPLDHAIWRTEASRVMADLFGGATAIEGDGAWCDAEREENCWSLASDSGAFIYPRIATGARTSLIKLLNWLNVVS